ncbi:MAG: selenocysteine-specific translation elongation factor [Treponemataceae bacterium]
MAYILGTAGHVDHGKTSLIKKLTGIETMHLPEEKKRGMTIELGFAALETEALGTVGIVDVPGHERFIRNMVAGTWGLDAALLVIAADDGWMQMTTDHLRVLKAMHVNAILAVITKIDLADAETIELLCEEIKINCLQILGSVPRIVQVSSVTGEGIESLKKEITVLVKNSHRHVADKTFLYIDRVFTLKGIGITITGTLRGDEIVSGDELALYPGNVPCRVKNIQSHHQDVERIEAGSRTALNLKLNDKVEVKRGMLLTKNTAAPTFQGSQLLVRVDEFFYNEGQINTFKNHTELEIALGTTHAIGTLHLNAIDHSLGRLALNEPIACTWNQSAVLIRHGGSSIIAACRVLAVFDSYNKAQFKKAFQVYSNVELPSWQSFQFKSEGFLEKEKARIDELVADKNEVVQVGSYYCGKTNFSDWQKIILKGAEKSTVGFTAEELDIPIPLKLKIDILQLLCSQNKLEKKAHRYILKGKSSEKLSANAEKILALALKAGTAGIEADKLTIPQSKKEIRDLVTLNKLVLLEKFLYFHKDVYDKVAAQIMAGKKAGDIISIAEAREKTGLSRKYIIPVLNILEKDKKVKRSENDRIVL